ncbi:hypothetical protein BKA70DRAFT_1220772 [Coprinopsis sp. MPI-PUGE-AT-0042]|nr:hypothetical protein BKA70DRAFT_1220772 [Coprinopsis sp. MPI-PUGE-AT-0042]
MPTASVRCAHIACQPLRGATTCLLSGLADEEEDWQEYYLNRFVDRDMLMRFFWGLGVGHVYSHKDAPISLTAMPTLQEGPEHEAADPRPGVSHKSGGAPSDASSDGHHSEGTDSDDPELGLSDKEAQELEMESEAEPEDEGWGTGPSKRFTKQSRVKKGAKTVENLAYHEREQEEPADIMGPVGPPVSSAGKRGKVQDAGRVSNSLVSEGERGEPTNEDHPLDGPGPSTLRRGTTGGTLLRFTLKRFFSLLSIFLIVRLVNPARTLGESHQSGPEASLYRVTTTTFLESPVHRLRCITVLTVPPSTGHTLRIWTNSTDISVRFISLARLSAQYLSPLVFPRQPHPQVGFSSQLPPLTLTDHSDRSMQSKRVPELCEGTTNHVQTATNYVINPLNSKTLVLARSADVAEAEGARVNASLRFTILWEDLFTKRLQQHLFPRLIRRLLAESDGALEKGHLGSLSALRDLHAEVDTHQDLPPMAHWPAGYIKFEMDRIVNHEDIDFQCPHGAPHTTIQERSTAAIGRRTDSRDRYIPFRIHGIFRANVAYTGPGALDSHFHWFDILWVQRHVVTDSAAAFDNLLLPARLGTRDNNTFLVDPTDVRCSCHLIRSFIPDPGLNSRVYYVNGYIDRDSTTMQTIGRNHRSPNLACIEPATEDSQTNLRSVLVETPGDNPQQRSLLENIPTGTLCPYGKPGG